MTARKSILLVDDDGDLRQSLVEQLGVYEEFSATEAENGGEALEITKTKSFDLILLNIDLSDMDGRELCKVFRHNGIETPIIMLIGANSEADTILDPDSGANDYVTKPFRLGVLLARIHAQLRQHEQSEDATFSVGRFTFHPAAKMVIDRDSEHNIHLTEKENAILKYLCRARDQVIGRNVLLNEVWGYNAGVATHTLETHIYRLRQKIELDPSRAQLLVTEGGGYRLVR